MDYIDLVLINKFDPNCPTEEVIRAMTYLINHGKVMYWGTARWSPVELVSLRSWKCGRLQFMIKHEFSRGNL